jgi:hypothetical protein
VVRLGSAAAIPAGSSRVSADLVRENLDRAVPRRDGQPSLRDGIDPTDRVQIREGHEGRDRRAVLGNREARALVMDAVQQLAELRAERDHIDGLSLCHDQSVH